MKVVITGASSGMGEAAAILFADEGYDVVGIDVLKASPKLATKINYCHYIADVSDPASLPQLRGVNILINNAGVQDSGKDIDINLRGVMNCTEKYALGNDQIRAVLNQASVSAHMGTEFPEYVASKGGVLAYTKWTAKEIAKYGATCNGLSFGGVLTELNSPVINDEKLWNDIMSLTPLEKWATCEEAAQWMLFMTTVNKSCSGVDIVIDNLESLNGVFVWK